MPIFDYKCSLPGCDGERKNVLVKSHRAKIKCPVCNHLMTRLWSINQVGIQGDLPGINIRKQRETAGGKVETEGAKVKEVKETRRK